MSNRLLTEEEIRRETIAAWCHMIGNTPTPPSVQVTDQKITVNGSSTEYKTNDRLLSLDDFSSIIIQPLVGKFKYLQEAVDHPRHYGGADNPFEVIKVLEAWLTPDEFRGFLKGNAIKYNARARLKGESPKDHAKAAWYQDYLVKWEKKVEEQKANKA